MNKKLVFYLTKWQVQAVFLFLQLTFSLFGFYNYFFNFNLSQKFLTQQILDHEKVIAKSGAKSIEVYLNNLANQLFLLESNDLIDQQDLSKTRLVFHQFINTLDSSITDIARYDKEGKLIIIENKERIYTGENENYSDRDFIKWSALPGNENKLFISAPYVARAGAAKGKVIFVIATPSYLNHTYQGTVAIRFMLQDFKKQFINPLGSSDDESIITDSKGTILVGKDSLANQNFLDFAQKVRWDGWQTFSSKFKEALSKEEGASIWAVAYPFEERKEVLVAYRRIDIPFSNNDLTLFITRNKPAILSSLTPFLTYGTLWLGGSIILTFFVGIILIVIKKIG